MNLTLEQIEANKLRFTSVLALLFDDTVATAVTVLLEKTDFFLAPYTAKYKGSYAGGLCEHCLNVYDRVKNKSPELAEIALIHDIGKVNYFEWTEFAKKVDGVWQGGYRVREASVRRPLGNFGFKSYLMIRNLIPLTENQITALCNFVYVSRQNDCVEILTMMEQNPLIALLHIADIEEVYAY